MICSAGRLSPLVRCSLRSPCLFLGGKGQRSRWPAGASQKVCRRSLPWPAPKGLGHPWPAAAGSPATLNVFLSL